MKPKVRIGSSALVALNAQFWANQPRKVSKGSSTLVAVKVGYRAAKLAEEGWFRVMAVN